MSPDLDLCDIYEKTALASSLDCPPAPGTEICTIMSKLNLFNQLETSVLKIDTNRVVWKLDSGVWSVDNDYLDGIFTAQGSESHTAQIGWSLLNENECDETTASETMHIEFQVTEDCGDGAVIVKSPYR